MRLERFTAAMLTLSLVAGCSLFDSKKNHPRTNTVRPVNAQVQTQELNEAANERAMELTKGWPSSATTAAREIIARYGEPTEVNTSELVWRNVQPFKRIVVHRIVYFTHFPLLHPNAVEHVVNYRAPAKRVENVWVYNGSVVLDRVRGEMAANGNSEAMNVLSLNLANKVLKGEMSASGARIQHGKEALAFINGDRTTYTQTLLFGDQLNTADLGEAITDKIRWPGERKSSRRQAQEAK